MKSKHRPWIRGIVIIAALDILCIVTMIADPDLTERMIPALACIQIFGFVVIALVSVNANLRNTADSGIESSSSYKEWILWFFGGMALLYFLRAGLAALAAADGSHSGTGLVAIRLFAMGGFFVLVIFLARRSMRRRGTKTKEEDSATTLKTTPRIENE